MLSKKNNRLLARTNFPLYAVHCLTERHILVAGGGGGAKTGIPNVIEIYELISDGSTCRAESITHFETGLEAIMNCAIHNAGKYFILFAGMEGNCHLYKIKHVFADDVLIKEKKSGEEMLVRQRKNRNDLTEQQPDIDSLQFSERKSDANANVIHSKLEFEIKHLESFQTDFSDDPFQKLVRFNKCSNMLVTGGADGHIRVWKHPGLIKIHDIEAHTDDVDDIDICPDGKTIVSISRDGYGKVWNVEDALLISELKYVLPSSANVKYKFRSCRYGIVDDKNDLVIFATLNPAIRSRPPSPSFVCKWDTRQYSMKKITSVGTDMLTAMAVSDDGRFIGLGTQEGSVQILIAFSLQKLYSVNKVHGIFVTGLEFLPSKEESQRITGGHETSLISISVDNHIIVHHIPMRPTIGIFTLILLLIVMLFFVFVILDYFNL